MQSSIAHPQKRMNNAVCSNLDGPRDGHTKSERERQTLCDITYMWNLRHGTNEPTYDRNMNTGNSLVVVRGKGLGEDRRRGWDQQM